MESFNWKYKKNKITSEVSTIRNYRGTDKPRESSWRKE